MIISGYKIKSQLKIMPLFTEVYSIACNCSCSLPLQIKPDPGLVILLGKAEKHVK
jgi:hypothetical protein